MLRTNDANERAEYALIYGSGIRMWRTVSFELRLPYFLICHAQKDGEAWLYETSILWCQEDVIQFCREVQLSSDKKIAQLSMFMPMPDANGWRLEELSEIWSHHALDVPQPPIFIAQDGTLINKFGRHVRVAATASRERVYLRLN